MNEQDDHNIPDLVWDKQPVEKTLLADNRRPETAQPETTPMTGRMSSSAEIKTYQRDMQELMSEGKGGTMASVLEEARRQEIEKENKSAFSRKNLFFLILSIIMLGGIGFIAWYVIKANMPEIVPAAPVVTVSSMIEADDEIGIDITAAPPEKIESLIKNAMREKGGRFQRMTHIYFTKETSTGVFRASLQDLLSGLQIIWPENLTRGMADNFMFGMYTTTKDHPFFIFEVEAFDRAFLGMQEWEPNMLNDMKTILAIDPEYLLPDAFTRMFEDQLIQNRSMRVLSARKMVKAEEQVSATELAEDFIDLFNDEDTLNTEESTEMPVEGVVATEEAGNEVSEEEVTQTNEDLKEFLEEIENEEEIAEISTVTQVVDALGPPEPIIFYTFLHDRILVLTTSVDVIVEIRRRFAGTQL